jgi:hypothetical protein
MACIADSMYSGVAAGIRVSRPLAIHAIHAIRYPAKEPAQCPAVSVLSELGFPMPRN